jgi:hypothetical protein
MLALFLTLLLLLLAMLERGGVGCKARTVGRSTVTAILPKFFARRVDSSGRVLDKQNVCSN